MAANCVLTAFVPLASNGGTWAFGGGVPIGGGLGNPRPNNGPMTSFAQTIGGSSQPGTPLDLSWVSGFSYVLERHCQKG
jgi:CCR4-NOT transcription complex subunit 2